MKNTIKLLVTAGLISSLISCESKGKEEMGGRKADLSKVQVVNGLDPVCKMSTSEHLKDTLTYEGKLYGFCSSNCKGEFKTEPNKFLEAK